MKVTKQMTNDSPLALKLVKEVAIAHSGIYTYHRSELSSLGINEIPEEYNGVEWFNVYRPAILMQGAVDLFTNLPVTVEHPDVPVSPENSKDLMKGFTGNEAYVIMEDNEAYIHSVITLIDEEAIRYYNSDYREVSPGYVSENVWESGNHNGIDYQIKMINIMDVNHLALTVKGRGGPMACVRDSIITWAKLTKDGATIREQIKNVAKDRSFIRPIITSLADLPFTGDVQLLKTCLEDLETDKNISSEIVDTAVTKMLQVYDKIISDNCDRLNNIGGSMEDTTEDYQPGTVGISGAGSQEPTKSVAEKVEEELEKDTAATTTEETKSTEDADESKDKPEETGAEDSDTSKDDGVKDACKDAEPTEDSLTVDTVLKAVLDSNKAVLDAVTKLTEALTPKQVTADSAADATPQEPTVTMDAALVTDSDTNNNSSAIDDFMQMMRS